MGFWGWKSEQSTYVVRMVFYLRPRGIIRALVDWGVSQLRLKHYHYLLLSMRSPADMIRVFFFFFRRVGPVEGGVQKLQLVVIVRRVIKEIKRADRKGRHSKGKN